MPRIAVLVPCYKRPEYTAMCLKAIEEAQDYDKSVTFYFVDDGSCDGTALILGSSKLNCVVTIRKENIGLRNTIIGFFEEVLASNYEYITKIDNDCIVPANWLNDLVKIAIDSNADVLSPNVSESNAAHKYGAIHKRVGPFIPSEIVGGLWFMRRTMIEDMYFEKFSSRGIRAAFHIINQIVTEKEPRIGWTDAVTYGDVGHWLGTHESHIKTPEHASYAHDVGRRIAWTPETRT